MTSRRSAIQLAIKMIGELKRNKRKTEDRTTRVPAGSGHRAASWLLALLLLPRVALGQAAPAPEPAAAAVVDGVVVVELVADFDRNTLVSDLERFVPITEPVLDRDGRVSTQLATLGEESHLWVRNAHVDGRFFFERYYLDKYIGREARLTIEAAELGVGEHAIQPGDHRFALAADGTLHSDDPEIRIDGRTVRLRLHQVTIYAVDAARQGPAAFRQLPVELGLFALSEEFQLEAQRLPDPRRTFNPRTDREQAPADRSPLTNLISHQKRFYPLNIWLPANRQGQGYVLFPSWQAFHLSDSGELLPAAAGAPAVPGVTVEGRALLVPHRRFSGRLATRTRLAGGVANLQLAENMQLGATLAPLRFRAGIETPPEDFFLPLDNDFTALPHKALVADNTTDNPAAVRLLALEWPSSVFERGGVAEVSLRLLESELPEKLRQPLASMVYANYDPSLPTRRDWQPVEVLGWENGHERGSLRFRVPEAGGDFVVFRVRIEDSAAPDALAELSTGLRAELPAALVAPGQQGSASFAANRGRDAFVAGEEIRLSLTFRSAAPRPAGRRTVVLQYPDGAEERLAVDDPGTPWAAVDLLLPGERSGDLWPGRYRLAVRDLPAGIAAYDFAFDLVGRQPSSLYHVIKASKYTPGMTRLEVSHLRGEPVDLERAMRSLAELGYNRVDQMTYLTQRHRRVYTWREELAGGDPRLPSEASVFAPSPRNQMVNACVRQQMQYADVWLSYNDFHLPRHIEPYIKASERWLARELQDLRDAPSFDGLMLYDEMYESGVSGLVESHQNIFARLRATRAEEELGQPPSQIEGAFERYRRRPAGQREPAAMEAMIGYRDWQQKGWADYVDRMVAVGRQLAPAARFGTFKRTWGAPGSNNDGITHGYPPDLFRHLDIISHVHYADNSTGWVNVPSLARILRTGSDKLLYINQPLTHESRSRWDGQYTRMMAFALLAHGANGISQYGLPHTFEDGPNPGTLQGRETTRWLNMSVLQPFGELIDRTVDGDRRIGIVSTLNQLALSSFNEVPVSSQTEGIWFACQRLGYPAVFLREEHAGQSFADFAVIFVPGVRFEGQLDERLERRLREAIAAGTRVVVEQGSALALPGLVRLDDQRFDSAYFGTYFATWLDDELNQLYQKTQPIVDYLAPLLASWGVEPAARGEFTQGPAWRDGGAIQYLVMANFDDPDYGHAIKQIMARPRQTELRVAARRGRAAYDLLRQAPLELRPAPPSPSGLDEVALTLDQRRIQGALVAFVGEPVGSFEVDWAVSPAPARLRLDGRLRGASGALLDGVFPTRIVLRRGDWQRTFHRVMGRGTMVELDLPRGGQAGVVAVEVREALSGETVAFELPVAAGASGLRALANATPLVPYPHEVSAFLGGLSEVSIAPAAGLAGAAAVAEELAAELRRRGVRVAIVDERQAYRVPTGDPALEDPFMDGYHSWRGGQEVIGPPAVVDGPLILLGGRGSLFLVDLLAEYGCLTYRPRGGPGQAVRPSIQVAHRAFNVDHDTLCLLANEATGLRQAVAALWQPPTAKPAAAPAFGEIRTVASAGATTIQPAAATLDTNEMVLDIQFDAAGNAYAITWGHGDNLFSFAPDGQLRFRRHLPEMGANRLQVAADRLLAHTAAGARVYQLTLDGQPLSQARLNADPGSATGCDDYELASTDFHYDSAGGRLLHNLGERMRVLDDQYRILAEWPGEAFVDQDVSDEIMHRRLHGYALSPDGERLAQLEASWYFTQKAHEDEKVFDTHLVLRDRQGKLLHRFEQLDNGLEVRARLHWPADAAGPVVQVADEWFVFDGELKLLARRRLEAADYSLGGGFRRLVRDGRHLVFFEGLEQMRSRLGPFALMPTVVALSADQARLATLDEEGLVQVFRTADGQREQAFVVPQLGQVLRFTPDGQRLLLGAIRSRVMAFELDGTLRWEAHLAAGNDWIGGDIPLYDPAFPDGTETLWPVRRDTPGDLEQMVRLGDCRLLNGDAETDGGWQGAVAYDDRGRGGRRSLLVGPEQVTQEIEGYLGEHATWVLEFHYRARGEEAAELLAGLLVDSRHPDAVVRTLAAKPEWQFARLAIKSGAEPKRLTVGFAARRGELLVDDVQLRRLRFPSVNHMLHRPFHEVKVVVLDNPLYDSLYDPFGSLREAAPNRVVVPPIVTGALNLVESAYLQNGRINNLSSRWYIQPFGYQNVPQVSLGFAEPRWISLLALYFNAYDEANVAPHFDIYAEDIDGGGEILVAQIRHNAQLLRLVSFPPVRTTLVTLRLVNSIARLRTLTEVEAYGPLSGRDEPPAFLDAEGENTYMGNFTRVDKRRKTLAADYREPVVRRLGHGAGERLWNVPVGAPLIDAGGAHLPRAFGVNNGFRLDAPAEDLYWHRAGGFGYAPVGTLYAGLILRPGVDGRLSCLDPGSGQLLWSTALGQRLFGAPVAVGDDLLVANGEGQLYRIDLADGGILGEATLPGGVLGSPATDGERLYLITDDGGLHAYGVDDLAHCWTVAVAPHTDSTPAVDGGVVYLADQQGVAQAVEAATGAVRWRRALGQEFARCPVVLPAAGDLPAAVLFGCRGGKLVLLDRADGREIWARQVNSRFHYEPLLLDDQILHEDGGQARLAARRDGESRPLQVTRELRGGGRETHDWQMGRPQFSFGYYQGRVVMVPRNEHGELSINFPWHHQGGTFVVLNPAPPAAPVEEGKPK